MSNLVEHARFELRRAGMYDSSEDNEYNKLVADAVMELMEVFAKQGHSGFSAGMTLGIFKEVANFKPLSPISSDPSEWMEVSPDTWQNTRRCSTFSRDGGKTWYDLDDPKLNNGDVWKKNSFKNWLEKMCRYG